MEESAHGWGVDVGEGVAVGPLLVVGCMTKYASTFGMVCSRGIFC